MNNHKKLYLLLVLSIFVLVIFVITALKQTSQIKINKETKAIVQSDITVIPIEKNDPILGNPGAPITIVEFLNFGVCKKKCKEDQQKIMSFVRQNPKKVRLIWKDAPSGSILLSNNNEIAHVTSYCVGTKDKFWNFIDLLTNTKEKINDNKLYDSFKTLEITESYMKECIQSDTAIKKIGESFSMARELNLKGSLNLFINNKKIYIAKDRDVLEILNRLLEE